MVRYFDTHASRLSFPEASEDTPGLRRAQRGAVFAIGAHFSLHDEAALISMPTGTGKTGVLMVAPFLLKARRALVITPSRMVRDQIAEEFSSLELLKQLQVLPRELPLPVVTAVESKILRDEQWEGLSDSDVVVATPMGSSPAIEEIPHPPDDLFDLLLIDEAHHSPARTWKSLMDAFPKARHVLFTATPFRRDRKQLPGKFVYEFPLREALRDGVFGNIQFIACNQTTGESNDVQIAKRAEVEYRQDIANDFDHRLMVRTDSRMRAKELQAIYTESTGLKLAVIHGQHTLRHVRRTTAKLREGDLDGVICVDMFGEGVDIPQLKIAAIHSPHRSLAVTLQFIGRFARTGPNNQFGVAKFIAVPEEIETETKVLYQQGAVWEELVTNLADSRVADERELHDNLRTFSGDRLESSEEEVTVSIIKPWYHCKIFRVNGTVDLHADVEFPGSKSSVQEFVSEELSCSIYVCNAVTKPRWLEIPAMQDVEHHLFIIHYDENNRFLFINSSVKTEDVYSAIAEQVVEGTFVGIPTHQINRALRSLEHPSFFNIGLKNRLLGNQVESYRILSGGKVDGAVTNTDAQLFDRGHVFGSGDAEEGRTTLGISTLSKVWSNRTGFVPEFVAWCRAIGVQLANSAPVVTGSRIDLLDAGEEATEIPSKVIGASWHETAYKIRPIISLQDGDDEVESHDLLSIELEVNDSDDSSATISVLGFSPPVTIRFRIGESPQYYVECDRGTVNIRTTTQDASLAEYLNSFGLHLYLADFSRLHNRQLFRSNLSSEGLPNDAMKVVDWTDRGIDIESECETSDIGNSIHGGIAAELVDSDVDVVVYDHRPGEIADYVSIFQKPDGIFCEVFHCKASGGPKPGSRVDDAYEVAGQLVKSVSWSKAPSALKAQLVRRLASGSSLLKGTVSDLERILDAAESRRFEFHVRLVQPGLSVEKLSEPVRRILAAAHNYVRVTTGQSPVFWVSQ